MTHKLISLLAAVLVAILAVFAFILSYHSLRHLAEANGITGWLSYLWPLLLDFAMVVFSLAILRANLRGEATWYAWGLTVIFAGLATIANVLDVTRLGIPDVVIGAAVKAIAPVALVLAFELLMQMVKAEVRRAATVSSLTELTALADSRRAELDKLSGQITAAKAKLEQARAETVEKRAFVPGDSEALSEANDAKQAKVVARRDKVLSLLKDGLSQDDISGHLGVSLRTVQRDIGALNGKAAEVAR